MQDAGEMRGRINNRKRLGACRTLLQLGGRLVSVCRAGVKMWHSWVCKDVGGMHAMEFWGLRGLKRGVRDTTTPAQVESLAVKTKSTTRAPWSTNIGFQSTFNISWCPDTHHLPRYLWHASFRGLYVQSLILYAGRRWHAAGCVVHAQARGGLPRAACVVNCAGRLRPAQDGGCGLQVRAGWLA